MSEDIHPIEDAFHRIQSPAPAMTLDSNDEVHDAVCLELWNAGLRHHEVQVAVSDHKLILTGLRVPGPRHRKCLAAAKRRARGRTVVDETITADSSAAPSMDEDFAARIDGRPAIFVTRYCGLDAASIRAGIASAIAALEAFLPREPALNRKDAVLIYRNLRADTVTIGVGYVVPDGVGATADDQIRRGRTPFGPMLSNVASHGGHALAKDFAALRARALHNGLQDPAYFWQQLPDPHDPWPEDRPTRLFAAWK